MPKFMPLYTAINLSTTSGFKEQINNFARKIGADISDIHTYTPEIIDKKINLAENVPNDFINYKMPLVYYVDHFILLAGNEKWKKLRDIENDVVYDSRGNRIWLRCVPDCFNNH